MAEGEALKKIVVIGAGIIGACTALKLQREGHSVTLVDRDEPGLGSSFGNALNTLEVDGRTLVDAGVSYTYKNVTGQVNATNLFDKQYFTTCSSTIDCYEGTRRSVIARVKASF